MAQTFSTSAPRIGKTTGLAKPAPGLKVGTGIKPKMGGMINTTVKTGALKENLSGGNYGKARVRSPVRGMAPKGLINR